MAARLCGKTKSTIPKLMHEARLEWQRRVGKQSRTLRGAYLEYTRRYVRNPPAGFDVWWSFANKRRFLMVDEFDLMDENLAMYRAFTPDGFRARAEYATELFPEGWDIRVTNGMAHSEGPLKHSERARGAVDLMASFVEYLPDMFMWFNGDDHAQIAVAYEERERLIVNGAKNHQDNSTEPPFHPHYTTNTRKREGDEGFDRGMSLFCPQDSVVRKWRFEWGEADKAGSGTEMPPLEDRAIASFISDHKAYMNLCDSVRYRHFHTVPSSMHTKRPTPVLPILTSGVQVTAGDIRTISTENFNDTDPENPPWEKRENNAAVWRGRMNVQNGDSRGAWKTSQRARLHLVSREQKGSRNVVIADKNNIAHVRTFNQRSLNEAFLDAGLVGPAVQCGAENFTCDDMDPAFKYDTCLSLTGQANYKYVLDVDGNSSSGRFRRLMLSNAAVLKATVFPEFWTDWAVPWLHYIPIQADYSDLWDVLAYFRGDLYHMKNHDASAREIALAGREFAQKCLRWEDLEVVQFRLMLEYARLLHGRDFKMDP